MPAVAHRLEFAPPMPQGTGRAFGLAVLAHLFLAGALTWGVSWKRSVTITSVEAELWSELPKEVAPKPQTPAPSVDKVIAPTPAPLKTPDIVVDKTLPKTATLTAKTDPKPEIKPAPQLETKLDSAQDEKKLAKQREKDRLDNIKRMENLASNAGSGAPTAQGTAQQASGPGSAYSALIRQAVKPNLAFAGRTGGNPRVMIEVRLAPDGTVLGAPRILQSSGNKSWDEAVVRAFEKTEVLPRDNGKIWTPLVIDWRMND